MPKKKDNWTILGDRKDLSWMEPLDPPNKCIPQWESFQILKGGLAIWWGDNELAAIQDTGVSTFCQEYSKHCREDVSDCAMLTTTGLTCYEIMLKAFEDSRQKGEKDGTVEDSRQKGEKDGTV